MTKVGTLAFALVLGQCSTAIPLPSQAQQTSGVFRIGVLGLQDSHPGAVLLRRELRTLGYAEGRNLVLDFARAEGGEVGSLPALAAELTKKKPNLLLAISSNATQAAMQATESIPIVMSWVSDPVGSGFVKSLASPGGNVTGVTDFGAELAAKHVELFRSVAPEATRLGVLVSDSPSHPTMVRMIEQGAAKAGLSLVTAMVRSPSDLEPAFALLAKERVRGLIVLGGTTQAANRAKIVDLAAKGKLATIASSVFWARRGGLVSYGPDLPDTYRQVATFIDKILRGAKPADLPVQQPTRFEMVINLKTAKALGTTIPQSVLLRADEVIQ